MKLSVWLFWGAAATIVTLSCAMALTTGFNVGDESWFLRVLQRVNSGEVLYRDVYYPLLPLAVYVGAAVTAAFGPTFLVLQAMFFAGFLATVGICGSVARKLELRPPARALLLLALCVWSSPTALRHVGGLYQPLATLFLLLCLRMVLGWLDQESTGRGKIQLVIGAIAAGAGFATKDQVGAVALAALVISVGIVAAHRGFPLDRVLRTGAVAVATFITTILVTLVPVQMLGGLAQFAEYFIVEREAYIRTSYVPYHGGIDYFLRLARNAITIADLVEVVRYSLFLIQPAALLFLIITLVRAHGEDRMRAAILLAFSVGAFLVVFPRSDVAHLVFASAVVLIGIVYAGDRLFCSPTLRRLVSGVFVAWMGVGLGAAAWESARRLLSEDYALLRLPHFEFVMLRRSEIVELQRNRDALVAAANSAPVFLLTADAGFYYLVSGIRNPTAIDYPMVASMGRDGEERLIAAIRSRHLPLVCVRPYPDPLLRPARLEKYVQTEMLFVSHLGFCDLYRAAD
jgi:hypothetical protein